MDPYLSLLALRHWIQELYASLEHRGIRIFKRINKEPDDRSGPEEVMIAIIPCVDVDFHPVSQSKSSPRWIFLERLEPEHVAVERAHC